MDEKIILPPKYYLDNFEYLLNFVKEKYDKLLNSSELQFLSRFYSLSEDARCLFVRFTNRKGFLFKTESLKYDELGPIDELIDELLIAGFLFKIDENAPLDIAQELVILLTKAEILSIFKLNSHKALKKVELETHVLEHFEKSVIITQVAGSLNLVKIQFEFEVAFFRFLFFGNRAMDMTEFVLRDMGMIQYYNHSDDDLVARFETRKDAEDKWMVSDQYLLFNELKNTAEPQELKDWYLNLSFYCRDISEIAKPSFDKLSLKIAKHLEQKKNFEYAIEVYNNVIVSPARERKTRCLVKLGLVEEAKDLLKEMLENPLNNDELYFAEYFILTLTTKKQKKHTTEWLNESEVIFVDKIYKRQVELGAIDYYFNKDLNAGFSENYTWRSIFGLWFWDIIFDPSLVTFHHPFQRRPSDLYLPDFYAKRKKQVHIKLDEFQNSDDLLYYLREKYNEHLGTANPFVVWLEEIWEMVYVLVLRIELDKLKLIMIKIAEDIVENSRGFPDLLIWNDDYYELVEIKGPNDNLSNQQLFWFRFFKEIQVSAKVVKLKYHE